MKIRATPFFVVVTIIIGITTPVSADFNGHHRDTKFRAPDLA